MKTENNAESGLKSGMKSGMKTDNDAESGMKSGMKTTQDRIIQLIKGNPQISIIAIAEELKLAKSGIAKQMQQLQALGIIKRIGPDKGGHWEIVSEGKSK